MNAKNSQKFTIKSNNSNRQMKEFSQKQPSTLKLKQQSITKPNDKVKNQQNKQLINSGVQQIQKVINFIKTIKLDPLKQNSLIYSLNQYSKLLITHLGPSSLIAKNLQSDQKIKASSNLGNSNANSHKILTNQRRLLTQQENTVSMKKEQFKNKQNKLSLKNLKAQDSSKIFLPQIKKDSLAKPVQSSFVKKTTQKLQKSAPIQQKQQFSSQTKNQTKTLNKNPKSRFYQQKNKDVLIQLNENPHGKSAESKQNQNLCTLRNGKLSYDEIVYGLKKRLGEHVLLIQKLEGKIREFENKKYVISHSKNPSKDKLKCQQQKSSAQISKLINTKESSDFKESYTSAQVEVLKEQLRQRQSQLRNLWIILGQGNNPTCLPK